MMEDRVDQLVRALTDNPNGLSKYQPRYNVNINININVNINVNTKQLIGQHNNPRRKGQGSQRKRS